MIRLATPAVAALLGGCTSINATPAAFEGTRWQLTAINGHATPVTDRYLLVFSKGSFTGRMGCNTILGSYKVVGQVIVPGMTAGTQAGCYTDAPGVIQPMTYEAWAFGVLRRPMRMTWHADRRLTLSNAAGSIELELNR